MAVFVVVLFEACLSGCHPRLLPVVC
jgi:hypothetical protein